MQKICRTCGKRKERKKYFYKGNPDCKLCVSNKKKKDRADNPIETELVEPLNEEMWTNMKGWEKFYRISSLGRISSLCKSARSIAWPRRVEKILKPYLNSVTGYYAYVFSDWGRGGKDKRVNIHRLVATHFLPNPLNLPEVNHKDGDKKNNRIENLEWVSREQNIQHGFKNGLIKTLKGEKSHNCTLTNEQVLFIFNHNGSPRKLSRDLKMPYSKIASIRNGVSWNHITGLPKKYYGKEKNKPRFT